MRSPAEDSSLIGPVLDLGAGAGRASLFLQDAGHEVTAVDSSPGAVEVCRRRGVRDVRLVDFVECLGAGESRSGHRSHRELLGERRWQTVLLLCGNLGLAGRWAATRKLLCTLHDLCAPGALLIADTVDPTVGADGDQRRYQDRQVAAGNYVGEVGLRLVYGETVSPWWQQVNVRVDDVPVLTEGTGWRIEDHHIAGMDHYAALRR